MLNYIIKKYIFQGADGKMQPKVAKKQSKYIEN
jgi:hypothetical protein